VPIKRHGSMANLIDQYGWEASFCRTDQSVLNYLFTISDLGSDLPKQLKQKKSSVRRIKPWRKKDIAGV